MGDSDGHWMEGAVKHPGALRATAEAEGAMTPEGRIKRSWLEEKARGDDVTARRARLALTFDKERPK